MEYDAIVVGAGPAGASAALWLGRAGKRVLLLEKEPLPRYKPCGGGIPREALSGFPFDLTPVIEQEIERVRFRFRDGREVTASLPDRPVVMVMRDRFDYHILRHARAEVRDGSPVVALEQDEDGVRVETASGETFGARYLIGADGANSRVARLVGLRRGKRMGAAIEVEAPASDALLEEYRGTVFFLLGTPPLGYIWIFPKADHLSVGIGIFGGKLPAMRRVLRQEMARLGVKVGERDGRGHPLPAYSHHEPLHRGRVLLAGDAAGLVDPMLGEGIRYALQSGRLAAEAVLTGETARYTRRIQRQIGSDLIWGGRWAWVFYHCPQASFELGVRNPLFLPQFLRLFAGRTTYRAMALTAPFKLLLGLPRRHPTTAPQPETRQPETLQPETLQSGTLQSETLQPETLQPETPRR